MKKKEENSKSGTQSRLKQFRLTICAAILGILVLVTAAISGCGSSKLSDKFDEETVKAEAMKSIEFFNDHDYQSILDMGNDQMKSGITEEEFADASEPYLEKCGEFEEITKTVVIGTKDKSTGEDYAGVVMVGKYKSGKIQFTIGFNEEMELIQFLIK